MDYKKKIVIVGATSAIAEHCARLWLKDNPARLILLGRNMSRLERIAQDLHVRSPDSSIQIVQAEFLDEHAISKTVAQICSTGPVDIVLIAHGFLPDQDACQTQLPACRQALEINAISPVLYAEAFAHQMAEVNLGTIILIGSVAGERGRKSNYVYGAAKGLVTRYAQGLQHRFAASNIKVILVKPGPTDTPMTAHMKARGAKLASVEKVAQQIVDGTSAGRPVIYAPAKWLWIMMVIRHLPLFIFKRMNI